MSFHTTEKKIATHTESEFDMVISSEDMDELHRLHQLQYERGVRSIKLDLRLTEEGSEREFLFSARLR